jgi:Ca-activated chloride channel homolog
MNFAIILNVLFNLWGSFNEIAETNRLKAEAETAYDQGNFSLSAQKYSVMIEIYNITDERVKMNLAHSYYYLHDTVNAEFHYKKLNKSAQPGINSVSNHQLGVIAAANKDYQTALKYFRLALKSDPNNEAARYNYELIKKKNEQNEKKNPDKDKNKQKENQQQNDQSEMMENDDSPSGGKTSTGTHDEQGKSGESEKSVQNNKGKEQKNKGEGEKNKSIDNSRQGDEEEEYNELMPDEKGNRKRDALISQRLKLMNMSEDKAKLILESMKNSEIQYLQQIKKKGKAKYDKDKPDW